MDELAAELNYATCPGVCSCVAPAPEGFRVPTIGRIFVAICVVESVLLLALSALLFVYHDPILPTGQVYAVLGIACVAGCLYFTVDAIASENKFQYVAAHTLYCLFTFFIIFQVFHNPDTLGPLWSSIRFEVMGVKLAFQALYWGLSRPVWLSFGFYTYRVAGASHSLTTMFADFRLALSLMQLDAFASVILLLLIKFYLLSVLDIDFILSLASLAVSLVFFALGWWAFTHESRLMYALFIVASTAQPGFTAYKAYYLYAHADELPKNVTYTQFAVLGGLSLLLRAALMLASVRVFWHFDQGLKELVFARYTKARMHDIQRAHAAASTSRGSSRAPSLDAAEEGVEALSAAAEPLIEKRSNLYTTPPKRGPKAGVSAAFAGPRVSAGATQHQGVGVPSRLHEFTYDAAALYADSGDSEAAVEQDWSVNAPAAPHR